MSRRDWSLTILIVSFGGIWPTRFVRLFLATYAVRQLRCRQPITIYFSLGRKDVILIKKYSHSRRQTRIHWPDLAIRGGMLNSRCCDAIANLRFYSTLQNRIRKMSRMYSLQYLPTRILKSFRTVLERGKSTVQYTRTLNFDRFNAAPSASEHNNASHGSKWWSETTSGYLPLSSAASTAKFSLQYNFGLEQQCQVLSTVGNDAGLGVSHRQQNKNILFREKRGLFQHPWYSANSVWTRW